MKVSDYRSETASAFLSALECEFAPEQVLLDEPLSKHTTFSIGGPASVFVKPSSVVQVQAVHAACCKAGLPLRIIGCGSDLLICDDGLDAVVMQLRDAFSRIRSEGSVVHAQAGATNEQLAAYLCEQGLAGYEYACGIPGTIGGAAIMNAGAYVSEFKEVATGLTCLSPQGQVVELGAEEAEWSYRHSMMDEAGYIVLEAHFLFSADEPAAIQARMDDFQQRRREKQPLEFGSAGSTFKRPEGYFAGKLIQDAGLRGLRIGDAQVSEKHTGFVINRGHASAAEVRELIALVQERVYREFGVQLEPEVRMWGFEG